MHAYALGLADETKQVLASAARARTGGPHAPAAPTAPTPPRPVIRGGKSHQGKVGPRGGKSS
jgi:hypothetical protein